MITIFGALTTFALFIFITDLLLILRAWAVHEKDEYVNKEKPFVSVLVPAYNESVGIVDSVKSLLDQDYDNYEIIIVDDGSTDDTYEKAMDAFGKNKLASVFTKENDGKGMALNFAADKAKGEYLMCLDADTILVPHAISTMIGKMKPDVDGVAAMVSISNDYKIVDGQPEEAYVSARTSTRQQWLEYCRTYVTYRCSLKNHNVITVISGACGIISREMFEKCGGYKKDQLGEDMELTMNIHTNGGKVQFISETLAWTEAPANIEELGKQRVRWFRGGIQALFKHKNLLFRRKNIVFSWFMLPYIWISGLVGIWVEIAASALTIYEIINGEHTEWASFMFLWVVILVGHHINSVLIVRFVKKKLEIDYKKINRGYFKTFFEGKVYHFIYAYWLLKAQMQQIFNTSKKWNKLKRVGINNN
jgi:cellulose synthase/poly-beta-1,6-N-acetylglucosamine synthase-like glycosyltransferase